MWCKESDLAEVAYTLEKSRDCAIIHLQEARNLEIISLGGGEDAKNFNVLAFGENQWRSLDEEPHESAESNGTKSIIIRLNEKYSIAKLKITSQNPQALKNLKIHLYVRRYTGLFVVAVASGYGDRLIGLLNCMYLASLSNFNFGFTWLSRTINNNTQNVTNIVVDSQERVFEKDFIQKHSYNGKIQNSGWIAVKGRDSIEDFAKKPFMCDFGYYLYHANIKYYLKNAPKDATLEYPKLWEKIGFSKEVKEVLECAKKCALDVAKEGFIAIHLRSGDIVFKDYCYNSGHWLYKTMPIEAALWIIECNQDKDIVLYGEDREVLEAIKAHFKELKIHLAYTLAPELDPTMQTFFEIGFIAQAKEIYGASGSGFARLPALIGLGREPKAWNEGLSEWECAQIIHKYFNALDSIHPLHKAHSKYYYYQLYRRIYPKDYAHFSDTLESALGFNPQNLMYSWLLLESSLNLGNLEYSDFLAQTILQKPLQYTLKVLFECQFSSQIVPNITQSLQNLPQNSSYDSLRLILGSIYEAKALDIYKQLAQNSKSLPPEILKTLESKIQNLKLNPATLDSKLKLLVKENATKQKRINELDNAKIRIHNHLAYKLGSAMILSSKSLWGYIRMPYVLSYIKESHREEQRKYQQKIAKNPSLKLPKLESYADYQEALKEKQCFTYKLGEALIAANNVGGGGKYSPFYDSLPKCVG